MDINTLLQTLHPLERKVLPALKNNKTLEEIKASSKLTEVEAIRALQWLENKNILKIIKSEEKIISLDRNGKIYLIRGLPERQLINTLKKQELFLSDIKKISKLSDEELNISLGILKRKKAISINKESKIKLNEYGIKLLDIELPEEKLISQLSKQLLKFKDLKDLEAFENLKSRKNIIKLDPIKLIKIDLTSWGNDLVNRDLKFEEVIDTLTSDIIKTGIWKNKNFRRYDIKINVPKIYSGKKHFVNESIESIRKIWLELGFKEMTGNLIDTSFWNFDALFVPQDHPARDLQDTFFVKSLKYGNLPNKELVKKIKLTHENGWLTGSEGWKYKWDERTAKELVLRTHTTLLSVKTLATLKKSDLPAKFFSVGKVFRNETVDWAHLFEHYQVEGIVVGNVNFKHLIFYLKQFYKKMGYEKVRFRPGFFPYVEPGLEVDVFHPVHKEWIELGGAGIFRPEVVKPLLGDVQVLAWGLGQERIISEYYKINDLRDLYKNDLKQLREIKAWLK